MLWINKVSTREEDSHETFLFSAPAWSVFWMQWAKVHFPIWPLEGRLTLLAAMMLSQKQIGKLCASLQPLCIIEIQWWPHVHNCECMCLCTCAPSYRCHRPRRPAGCWWTVCCQKRWDPESSTASSGNRLSSTCHILRDRQKQRNVIQKREKKEELKCTDLRHVIAFPAAKRSSHLLSSPPAEMGLWCMCKCVCQCVMRRRV